MSEFSGSESSDADAQERQRQQELDDEAARQLLEEQQMEHPESPPPTPPAVEEHDDVAVTPPDEPEVKPASPPADDEAADPGPEDDPEDDAKAEQDDDGEDDTEEIEAAAAPAPPAEGPMPVHEEADSTIYVRELGVPDDRPETPAAAVEEHDDVAVTPPDEPEVKPASPPADDEAADPGPEDDPEDDAKAEQDDDGEDDTEEIEAAAGDEGEVETTVDEDATNEGATTEGGGDAGKGGNDSGEDGHEGLSDDGRDITERVAEVTAAEDRLTECQQKADELEQQYKEAVANGTDINEHEIAEAMDNAERDVISAFNTTEALYDGIRELTLEQRLEAIGASDMAPSGEPVLTPSGEPVGGWDFHEYREMTRDPAHAGAIPTSELRKDLLPMGAKGDNTALIQAELFSNYFDHVDDGDGRFFSVTRDTASNNLIVDYYCFAPVKDSTFNGFKHFLDPNNYDVEQRLSAGQARDLNAPTAAYGVPEDTGRGLALIVTHTLNEPERTIERMGHGAHIRVAVNPNDITRDEIRRILDEASGGGTASHEAAPETAEPTAEDLMDQYTFPGDEDL